MTKNPLINAGAATGYILLVVTLMNSFSRMNIPEDGFFPPLIMISLLTLSVAVMGYLFISQPLLLYFDGKGKQAVKLFLNTILVFASLTVGLLVIMLSGVFS